MVSAEQIEEALYERFTGKGKLIPFEIGTEWNSISRPAVNFAVLGGEFEDPGNKTSSIKQTFRIQAKMVVKNIRSDGESARRKESHPLILWILQKLWLNKLGLEISPILIRNWTETTNFEQLKAGLFEAEINATCRSSMDRLEDPDQDKLLTSILSGFTLPESTDPDRVVLESQIDLQETP